MRAQIGWGRVILGVTAALCVAWAAFALLDLVPDPVTGRLASGSEAIVFGAAGERLLLENATPDPIGLTYRRIDPGTRVRVLDDGGRRDSGVRVVRVAVIGGQGGAVVGEVPRRNLRPIR
jgi:hypothetical protein